MIQAPESIDYIEEANLKQMYNNATLAMYYRIESARRRRYYSFREADLMISWESNIDWNRHKGSSEQPIDAYLWNDFKEDEGIFEFDGEIEF